MIITTTICDKCKKTIKDEGIYTISIEGPYPAPEYMSCMPLKPTKKHLCQTCLNDIFS